MATYALTVSTDALGLGVINGARVTAEKKRTVISDVFPSSSLYKKTAATSVIGIATLLLEPDDGSVFHEIKIFDLNGILVFTQTITMPPQAIALDALPIQDIISASAAQAVSAAAAAATSASAATTQATNASNSASAATTQATNASNSASAATTQATNASNSASAAATSETNAANSETTATAQAVISTEQAVLSTAAKVAAEAARDAAIIGSDVYVDEPTGRAAVADGVAFKVQGSGDVAAYEYRRVNSGSSTLIALYPSVAYVAGLKQNQVVLQTEKRNYIGTDDLVPLFLDAENKLLLGVYKSTGKLYMSGALTDANVSKSVNDFQGLNGVARYTGSGDVYPIVTDAANAVLLGVDKTTGMLVGAGLVSTEDVDASINTFLGVGGFAKYTGTGDIYPFLVDAAGAVLIGVDKTTGNLVGAGLGTSTTASAALAQVQLTDKPIVKSINHLLFYGQSLSVGANAGSVISTTQPYSNITFNGGPRAWTGTAWDFTAFKPLVEDAVAPAPDGNTNRAETCCSGAANYASTVLAKKGITPTSHVILSSTAGHGGYKIALLNKASAWYANYLAHVNGANTLNANHAVHAVGWLQGENDIGVTDYATYRAALEQLQTDLETDTKAITGQTSPVYLLTYQLSWGIKTSTAQAFAQLDLAQKNSKVFLVCPTYFLPFAGDNVHLTALGYKWIGAYFGRAYASLIKGVEPQWLNPVAATHRDAVITLYFDVPQAPLVLDNINIAATTDYGFLVKDDATTMTITNVVAANNTVAITLSTAPTGVVKVRYALDFVGTGLTLTNGASGNLRDSTTDTITISGGSRNLWHLSPAFELTSTKLGE